MTALVEVLIGDGTERGSGVPSAESVIFAEMLATP